MRFKKTAFITFLLIFSSIASTFAQNTSTQGKEFWLTFMHNGFKEHADGGWVTTQVLISAKRDCTGTISNPSGLWQQDFSVRANSITTIEVPERNGYHDGNDNEQIGNRGVKIVATDTISVYTTNIAHVSFDASFVLPTESLGDDYIIQSYDQSYENTMNSYVNNNLSSAFVIIATENDTEIDITPSVATLGSHPAGETFTITLNAGQTYQVRSNLNSYFSGGRDLSGTRVTASDCKKIAIFNGNTLTCIPVNMGNGYDHIYEQAMPLRSWGKNFVVTSSSARNRDFVKITSAFDNNVITKNGEPLTTLQASESYTFSFPTDEHSCFLSATQSCAVYLYNNSSYDQNPLGGLGDPSMVWIAPVEQRINEVTFTTFNNSDININCHYVNIIVNSEDINSVYLDDVLISPLSFRRVNGNNDYSYSSQEINHGVHHLRCANGFNAHVYGFGQAKGYAYLVGSNAIDLSTNLIINDLEVRPNDIFDYCIEEPVTFAAEVNYENYTLTWDFGDGQTSTQNPATHTYHSKQIFPASLIVTADEAGCLGSSSDTTMFFIDMTQKYVNEEDQMCQGSFYSGFGLHDIPILNDTILRGIASNPTNPACQDSVILHISALPSYNILRNIRRCWSNTQGPGDYIDNDFYIHYDHPGTYEDMVTYTSIHGCDSTIRLNLEVGNEITHDFTISNCTGTYTWDGHYYNQPGDYERTYDQHGCDSIVTMHLIKLPADHITLEPISTCDSYHWEDPEYDVDTTFTESTGPNGYTHTYTNEDGCESDVTLFLTINNSTDNNIFDANEDLQLEHICDSYFWDPKGKDFEGDTTTIFTLSSNDNRYQRIYQDTHGCDSLVTLHVDFHYTPDPSEIIPSDTMAPHWVVPATEFQVNTYTFRFYDHNANCIWDNVKWECTNKAGDSIWAIMPYVDSISHPIKIYYCDLLVIDNVPDTIKLKATAFNGCEPAGISQEYWMVCSFYGTDEHETTKIDINPNPNNGTMTMQLDGLEGETQITVYDMAGMLVDKFNITATTYCRHDYQLPRNSSGLYLFVINNKGKTTTRKVIITQ